MVCCRKQPCNRDPHSEVVFASFVVVGFGPALPLVVVDFAVSLDLVEVLVPASYPVEAAYQAVKEVAEL